MESISLYNRAITPNILKLIIDKMGPTASVTFCQTGKFGKIHAEKYRSVTLENFSHHVKRIREYEEKHPWIKEYKSVKEAMEAGLQFIHEAEAIVDEMIADEVRTLQMTLELAKPLIEKGKILMDYGSHIIDIMGELF